MQYGFVIGQINETPALPKFIPAFLILHSSLLLEIIIILFWSKDDFEMVDPLAKLVTGESDSVGTPAQLDEKNPHKQMSNFVESMPSSLGGTLRINVKTANVFREVLASEELNHYLKSIESAQGAEDDGGQTDEHQPGAHKQAELGSKLELGKTGVVQEANGEIKMKNPQMILLKMILMEDGRVIKYICLFTIFGALISPMNFLFLSMEELCQEKAYNFSQLAGAVLISQALIETFAFLVVPYMRLYVTRWTALSIGLAIVSCKYIFYGGWYYTSDVSSFACPITHSTAFSPIKTPINTCTLTLTIAASPLTYVSLMQ